MNDEILMGIVHGFADGLKQSEPRGDVEASTDERYAVREAR